MYKYYYQKKGKGARAARAAPSGGDLFSPYRRRFMEETNDCWVRHAALLLVAFVVFTVLYVSFVVTRKCGDGTEESCTGNMILDEPSELDALKEEHVFGGSLNLMQNDSRLVDLITRSYLVPPAVKSYKLGKPDAGPLAHPKIIDFILLKTNGKPGFFVEAGAGDGEHLSNTLRLERDYGWTGLLVEPDPVSFRALRGKNRKSWLTNACLSLSGRAEEVTFHAHTEFPEKGRVSTRAAGESGNNNNNNNNNLDDWEDSSVIQEVAVKCFPVFSLLSAVNVTTVDFFSLNVQGGELNVLKTIPFDSVRIGIFLVQHAWLMEGKKALRDFMRSKGYVLLRTEGVVSKMDSLFVHSTFGGKI